MTTEEPPLSASSPLDKPLHLLTEDDISQITREQCRRFLSQKGMRRPSWNKSQAIQQVIMLKALIEPSPESDDIVALLLDNGADVNSRNYCGQICRYKEHRWDLKQLVGSGGMPSSHSATVTSLAVAFGLHDGLGGSNFATALILACILVFFVFNPTLVASNLASTITFESLISLWFMPVNILFTFIIGSALGWVLMIIAKPPQHLKGLILGTCSAGNLGNLLLIIIPAVYDATGVRLHVGRQAELLNQIVYELPAEHPLAESRPLHELLGHTPPQMMTLISKEAIEERGNSTTNNNLICYFTS